VQFIVSTFRPELVAVSNRFFGVSHQNKVSSLHQMSKKDALHFVANLMNEEEAVGDVTSLAASSRVSRLSRDSRKRKTIEQIVEEDEDKSNDDEDQTEARNEGTDTEDESSM
jgi:hypothetical protein